jgi:hypothetical protein
MNFSFWSDEDRLFVPRLLGWSINFKYIAKKLGWIKTSTSEAELPAPDEPEPSSETREERLRRAIERSRSEDA